MTTVEARARSMIDVPFLHLGRDRNGIDCVGLVAYAHSFPMGQIPAYTRDPLNRELERLLRLAIGEPVAVLGEAGATLGQLQPRDVVAMAYRGAVRHMGLVVAHPTLPGQYALIHTDSTLGRVTEHILDAKWLRRIREVYRP